MQKCADLHQTICSPCPRFIKILWMHCSMFKIYILVIVKKCTNAQAYCWLSQLDISNVPWQCQSSHGASSRQSIMHWYKMRVASQGVLYDLPHAVWMTLHRRVHSHKHTIVIVKRRMLHYCYICVIFKTARLQSSQKPPPFDTLLFHIHDVWPEPYAFWMWVYIIWRLDSVV